jgi:hypothetical protein
VEKIISVFTFLSYSLQFEILKLVFVIEAENEIELEMPSEMEQQRVAGVKKN